MSQLKQDYLACCLAGRWTTHYATAPAIKEGKKAWENLVTDGASLAGRQAAAAAVNERGRKANNLAS